MFIRVYSDDGVVVMQTRYIALATVTGSSSTPFGN